MLLCKLIKALNERQQLCNGTQTNVLFMFGPPMLIRSLAFLLADYEDGRNGFHFFCILFVVGFVLIVTLLFELIHVLFVGQIKYVTL
jgi:hypothetical protein